MRNRFISDLTNAAKINTNIALVVGDLGYGVVEEFADLFPNRFFNAGVAGAAGDHYKLLVFGLVLSIALMAFAATLISNWIKKYKWIAWAGLLAILIVAIELIYTDIKILFL